MNIEPSQSAYSANLLAGGESIVGTAAPATCYPIRAKLSQFVLFLYLFFVLFGTSTPFPQTSHLIEDKALANPVSQIIYSTLFLLALWCLLPRLLQVMTVIRREKVLTLLFAWCALSVCWSDVGGVSGKRLVQMVMTATISLTALLYCRQSRETLVLLLYVLSVYVTLSLLAVLFIPEAIDARNGAWRGMAVSKNHFGQAMVVSIMAWLLALQQGLLRYRLWACLMLAVSAVMLTGSASATGTVTMLIMGVCGVTWWLSSVSMSRTHSRIFCLLFIIALTGFTLFALTASPAVVHASIARLGRDSTFTGRTDLWSFIWQFVGDHPLLGCGYGGFWTRLNEDVLLVYDQFIWLPNQSHMGYLDIINELGFIGLALFIWLLVAYFTRQVRRVTSDPWIWFFAAALVINTQETTLFRPHILTGVLFIHAYLAATVDRLNEQGAL